MYNLLIIPFFAAIIAQIIKVITDIIKKEFAWNRFNSYGGMPSSHTALVVSLSASVGYYNGWNSAAFAICVIFSLIVIRDAVGFRKQLGLHAKSINEQISELPAEESFKFRHLPERIGHKPSEVFAGFILGLVVTVSYILLF